jgi:hypothetical protein
VEKPLSQGQSLWVWSQAALYFLSNLGQALPSLANREEEEAARGWLTCMAPLPPFQQSPDWGSKVPSTSAFPFL